jgi:TolB-like protein/tetratricopeptide (TPR) repeat protein
MLAGEPPFTGPTAQAVIAKRFGGEVPRVRVVRPSVPEAVDQVLQRALAPAAADRFATAAQLAGALLAAAPAGATPPSDTSVTPRLVARPRRAGVAITALLVLTAIAGVLWARRSRETAPGPVRLAVLPFDNQGAPQDEYFANGMTDEVRGKLSTLPGLRVIARSSSSEYKRTAKRPDEIGRELGVQYLLTATVHWVKGSGGDRVRVSPELIEARDASTRWQQSFDASVTDVFQVQGQIAGHVAQALDLVLGSAERAALGTRPTENVAAYDAFARGEAAASSLTEWDGESVERALRWYERAVALDSGFVRAWLQLTRAHAAQYSNGFDPTPTRKDRTRRAMERVVALRPNGYEAHWAQAVYAGIMNDLSGAAAEAAAALRLDPTNPELLRLAARVEAASGQWDAALSHLRQAALLDPRSPAVFASLAMRLLGEGRYDEATEAANRAMALDPTSRRNRHVAILVALGKGDFDGAVGVLRFTPAGMDTLGLFTDLAVLDYGWLLSDAQQRLVLQLPLTAFSNDRTSWGSTLADLYRLRGDTARSRAYADSAIVYQERLVRDEPDHVDQSQHLASQYAMAGRKAEAMKEADRALALVTASGERNLLPYVRHRLARLYVMLGEPERALSQLELALREHSYITPGRLRVDPDYAPLLGNPRFEELLEWER